jgi:hypothetical protein
MTNRDHRVQTYLTDEEHAKLQEWSDETGKSMSSLLRQAVLEYTDNDRTERIESELRDLNNKMDDLQAHLSDGTTHTHKPQGGHDPARKGSSSTEKVRRMIRRIHEHHAPGVKDDDVTRVIEDEAGADDRTVRKYKRLMRERGLLFEHPGEAPVWTTESAEWCNWIEDYAQLNGRDKVEEVAEQYPATVIGTSGGIEIEVAEEVAADE